MRVKKTMVDAAFSDATVQKIADGMFNSGTENGLRHRADVLLSLGLSSRGDNIRRLCLSHIGLITYENEGVCSAGLFRTVWKKSKKNQYGNIEETALMRHNLVERYPFSALALYFFHRWHVGDEPWPDFSERKLWYSIFVLKGAGPTIQSTYPQQYSALKEVYDLLGVQSTVKTQLGRKQAATTESGGASAESVDKQGHWATKSRNGAYVNHVILFDCVRVLAGFGPEPNRYYIPRALLDPPQALQDMIFPNLSQSETCMLSRGREIAEKIFMDLLRYMRVVILQDVVMLIQMQYKHPLFQHSIFKSDMFIAFRDDLIQKVISTPQPENVLLQQAIPIVSEDIRELRTSTARLFQHINTCLERLTSEIKETTRSQQLDLQLRFGETLVEIGTRLQSACAQEVIEAPSVSCLDVDEAICTHQPQTLTRSVSERLQPNVPLSPTICGEFRMSRQIDIVTLAWQEYSIGFPPKPSVKMMEKTFSTLWRKKNTDTQFYYRCKPLYEVVELGKSEEPGIAEHEIVAYFEHHRQRMKLRRFTEQLKVALTLYKNQDNQIKFRQYFDNL